MQPFDELALLAMLLTFYPVVSGAELRRARAERPEYFGAGRLIGTHGDALLLPDGTIWDLIQNVDQVGGPSRWQAIRPGPGTANDYGVLEPGPLAPVDVDEALPERAGERFESLALALVAEVGGIEGRADDLESDMRERAAARAPDDTPEQTLDYARSSFEAERGSIDELDPRQGLTDAEGLPLVIDDQEAQTPVFTERPDPMPGIPVPRLRPSDLDDEHTNPGEQGPIT